MLAPALRAEADAYVGALLDVRGEDEHRLVVRNGHAEPRQVMTAAGAIGVHAPRVNDKRIDEVTGERRRFASAILPAWCRHSPRIAEVLPLLYLPPTTTLSRATSSSRRPLTRAGRRSCSSPARWSSTSGAR